MRFTSLTALSVLLITFVLAIPAPDKYIHFKDPDCNAVNARACLLVPYCKNHRERGDLFTARGYLKSRGGPEPENLDLNLTDALSPSLPAFLPTKELGFIGRRARSTQCGVLAANSDISDPVGTLVPKVLYDLILDYPYDGATGGIIGVFSQATIEGVVRILRIGQAHTGNGGVRITFQALRFVAGYQIIFAGDNVATAAVNYYILRH